MSDSTLGAGEVVAGRFEILGPGGVGGMAVVHRAKDRTNGRIVALKVLSHARELLRFTAEAETLAAVKSPHVVGYVAHGDHAGVPYLAMDWLDGEDLDARLGRGPLPVAVAIDLVMRVALALGAAHRLGIVHRDVKPDNIILLGGDPLTPILVDFGVARLPGRRFTSPGLVLGTPGFFAPEQARAEAALDPRADVFALASVLFECVTGTPLWDGESVPAILTKILFVPAPRLDRNRSDVPSSLADLVERMLDKDPAGRPSDGQAVADALLAIDLRDTSLLPDSPRPPEPRARQSIGQGGRSVASVLVARLPPGALTPALSRQVRDMGGRFGATFEELADGSLAALVAGPRAATDLAVIATRLALAVRKAVPVRAIGVATGRTALGDRSELGGVIARAAALAAEDTARSLVNVDPTTVGLLGERFALVASGDGVAVSGEEREEGAPASALRGRKGELALGASRFRTTVSEPSSRALVLVGEAGIGKTALARALLHEMLDHESLPTVVSARGEPLYENAPFALVAALLRHTMGVSASPDVGALDAVVTWVGARMDGPEAARAVSVLAEILRLTGTEKSGVSAQGFGAGSLADRAHDVLVGIFREECQGVPVVFFVEDLQFADAPSVVALEELLRRLDKEPFFVLATARPEALERSASFFAAPNVQTLPVLPLSEAECRAWVRDVVGPRASDARVKEIALWSEGSPFVLGELLRAARTGSRVTPRAALAAVHARLESLPPDLLLALRGASVSGTVDVDDVTHVTGLENAGAALETLVLEDVLVRDQSGGAMRYAFKNRLLQEVAYGMLTAADRALAHSLAGARADARGDAAAIVAEHFMRAGAFDRAAVALSRAARDALAANDVGAAAAFAERGLETSPPSNVKAELYASLGEARLWQGNPLAAKEAAELVFATERESGAEKSTSLAAASALSVLLTSLGRLGEADALEAAASEAVFFDATPETAPVLAHALARGGMNLVFMGRFASGRALIAQLGELAASYPTLSVEARSAQAQSVLAHYDGNLAGHFSWAERALAMFDALGDRRTAAVLRTNVGDALRMAGELEKAEVALRAALEVTRAMGIGSVEGPVRANLGATLARLGRHDEAIGHFEAVLAMFEKASDRRLAASAAMYLGEVHVDRGDGPAAEAAIETGLSYTDEGNLQRPPLLALRARAALLAGRNEDALRDAERAMEELAVLVQLEDDEIAVHEAFIAALVAGGHTQRATAACEAALARLAELTRKLGDERLQASFVQNVPAHRRLRAMATRLGLARTELTA